MKLPGIVHQTTVIDIAPLITLRSLPQYVILDRAIARMDPESM